VAAQSTCRACRRTRPGSGQMPDPYPDLALARLLRLSLLKPENFRAAKLMKPNDFGHVVSFMPLDGRKRRKKMR